MSVEIVARNPKDFSDKLLSLKDHRKLCDASLLVNGKRYHVHSNILSASSDYFENMFVDSGFNEIILNDVNPKTVESIIEYCYTGIIRITMENARDIFSMASILSIPSIVDTCSKLLVTGLNIENSLATWRIGRKANFENLKNVAMDFVKKNFKKVSESEEFLRLDYSEIDELINEDLTIESEETVYFALKNWYKNDETSRSENFDNLLNRIKLECLPNDLLISDPRTMCNSVKCYDKIFDAIEKQKNFDKRKCPQSDTLVTIGSDKYESSKVLEIYDKVNKQWVEVNINCDKIYYASVLSDEKLLIIGGQKGSDIQNTVEYFDFETKLVSSYPAMKTKRRWTSAVEHKGFVYVTGGDDGACVSSVERFDHKNQIWSEVSPMATARSLISACILGEEIYVAGGRGKNSITLSSTEAYNISKNTWRACASMQNSREDFSMAAINGFLYALGTDSSGSLMSIIEKYDPVANKWTSVQLVGPKSYGLASQNLNGSLIIAGGYVTGYLSGVHAYDDKTNQWTTMAPIKKARAYFSLIAVPWRLAKFVLLI